MNGVPMNTTSVARLELRALDNSLHDLIVQLRRESSGEAAKKLLRIKNYAIRAFVAIQSEAGLLTR
jgi:hypothetical protein